MTRLLIDENLPIDLLALPGLVREHATALAGQPTDLALWEYARGNGLVIVTKDADFFDLLALRGALARRAALPAGNLP